MAAPNFILRAGGIDADVIAWYVAVVAAGGQVFLSTLRAVNQFAIGMKNAGLWQKCYMIDLCCGSNLSAALVRLKVPAGVAQTYTNINFVNGDYTEQTGLTGNGFNKYLLSGIDPSALGYSTSNLAMWAYLRTQEPGSSVFKTVLGNEFSGARGMRTSLGFNSNSGVDCGTVGGNNSFAGSGGKFTGLLGISANGSRSNQAYRNGAVNASPVIMTDVFVAGEFYKMAINVVAASVQSEATARTVSSALITTGLNAAEAASLYALVQAFETSLGRAV